MSRKSIWFFSGFAALALTALIIVQFVWINGAIEVQERQFDQLINQSIFKIISNLEEYETYNYLQEELDKESFREKPNPPNSQDRLAVDPGISYELGGEEDSMLFFDDIDPFRARNQLDLLSGDTLVFLNGNSLYDVNRSPSHARSIITQADLVSNYEQLYANKRVFVERLFNRMIRYEGTIESRLPRMMLDSVIQSEMDLLQINLPFEYAVKTVKENYSLASTGFNPDTYEKKFAGLLYPQDMITTNNFLVLYFTGQKGYIFQSVSFLAGVSLVLIFLILIISTLAIYVIVRQKKLSEIKSDFVNNMTHELKTPISTISLASEMLGDSAIQKDATNLKRISGLISEESKRLGFQVEKVLQMSIFDHSRMVLKQNPLNIDELISKVVDSFSLQLQQKGAKITLNLNTQSQTIPGDEIHLTNVLYNLLDNALKYSNVDPAIIISTRSNRKGITLKIKDNGIGMGKDSKKRIFEKFYRVPTGNIHNVKGFGLGLSYVKKIIVEHHGTIAVDSELTKGSEFTILLPFQRDNH